MEYMQAAAVLTIIVFYVDHMFFVTKRDTKRYDKLRKTFVDGIVSDLKKRNIDLILADDDHVYVDPDTIEM